MGQSDVRTRTFPLPVALAAASRCRGPISAWPSTSGCRPSSSRIPELIVACLYAWRLKADESLGALLSSKVNQWTLLVGSLPVVFAISSFSFDGLPLDTHQRYELLVTAAQSLFAVAILLDRRLTIRGAAALLTLFIAQFVVSVVADRETNQMVIVVLSVGYGVLAVVTFVRHRREAVRVIRDGTVTPMEKLGDSPCDQPAGTPRSTHRRRHRLPRFGPAHVLPPDPRSTPPGCAAATARGGHGPARS